MMSVCGRQLLIVAVVAVLRSSVVLGGPPVGTVPCTELNTPLKDCYCYKAGGDIVSIFCDELKWEVNDLTRMGQAWANEEELQDTLEDIIIRGNNFPTLPANVVGTQNFDEVITLDLTNNKIKTIEGKSFHHMFDLERLILDDNEIVFDGTAQRMFSSVNGIRVLSLRRAFAETSAQESVQYLKDIFEASDLRDMEELLLNDNHLTYVHGSTFENLPELAILNLASNQIINIDGLVTATCYDYDYSQQAYWNFQLKPQPCYLETLDLSNNQIHTVPMSFINELQKIDTFMTLDISDNQLICDCELKPFIDWLNGDYSQANFEIVNLSALKCAGPQVWIDQDGQENPGFVVTGKPLKGGDLFSILNQRCSGNLADLTPSQGANSCKSQGYEKCHCVDFDNEVVIINCTNQKMSKLGPLDESVIINVEEIIIQGNQLQSFSLENLLSKHSSKTEFDFLYTLAIPNNGITKLTSINGRGAFAAAADLERLVLDDNELEFSSETGQFLADLKDLEYLSLKHALKRGQKLDLKTLFNDDSFNNLEYLNLEENEILSVNDPDIFRALPELRELRLGKNKIETVDNLVSEKCLDYYRINTDPNSVARKSLKSQNVSCVLRTLDLSNNSIHAVPQTFLDTLKNIVTFQYLDLSGNPFRCDSSIKPLWSALRDTEYLEDITFLNSEKYLCPDGRKISDLGEAEVEKSKYTIDAPSKHSSKLASGVIGVVCVALLILILVVVYLNRKPIIVRLTKVTRSREYRPVAEAV